MIMWNTISSVIYKRLLLSERNSSSLFKRPDCVDIFSISVRIWCEEEMRGYTNHEEWWKVGYTVCYDRGKKKGLEIEN